MNFMLHNEYQINKFDNELVTMQKVHRIIDMNRVQRYTTELFPEMEDSQIVASTQESNKLRMEGNKLYAAAKREKRNILGACKLYTEAIFAASLASEALALAHANRALALLEFGYIQQAYDDCVCAREQGYPQHSMDKLLLRQADCAQKLGDAELLKRHLDELKVMKLNDVFKQKASDLQQGLEELLAQRETETRNNDEARLSLDRDTRKIVATKGSMVASQTIQEGEMIFREEAFCMMPIRGRRICHECATTQLIPIPCMRCRGKVVYCSLKCRTAQATIHEYECAGYMLIKNFDKEKLALRMVVRGLPQVVPLLRHKGSATALWTKLVVGDSSIAQTETLDYAKCLRVATSLDCLPFTLLQQRVLLSFVLAHYLKTHTSFFKFVPDTAASQSDWEIVTAALILRHLRQIRGFDVYTTLQFRVEDDNILSLLADNLWARPYRVQRGQLHQFERIDGVASVYTPFMGLAKHSCVSSLCSKFSGRYVSTFATKKIEPGEQISKNYGYTNYKTSKFSERSKFLKNTFNIICECVKCKRPNPDEDYGKYYRYRCERLECRRNFIQVPNDIGNQWWLSYSRETLKCTICGVVQKSMWFIKFKSLLERTNEAPIRKELFQSFDEMSNWVLGYHPVKLTMANELIVRCLQAHFAGFLLTNTEFGILVDMAKFLLQGMADVNFTSISYASKLTYLWDLIALGKHKVSGDEMNEMLKSIEFLSDEFKMIFMNYYDDYIKSQLSL